MQALKLFMVLLGCKPEGRHTEQHDIFFGIAQSLPELVPAIVASWPGSGKLHIDAWREVTRIDGHAVAVINKTVNDGPRLFFINLGGYKEGEFEEYHYKLLAVADDKGAAIQNAKRTAFYKHTNFPGADSHIDDKYGVDVDDLYLIEDILPPEMKGKYSLAFAPATDQPQDEWHLGYTKLSSLV